MRNRIIIFISLLIISYAASGQKLLNTPYSRFNLGTLNPQGSFRSLAMGMTGIAMRDNSSLYFKNPASYSSIDTMSFLFDFGADVGYSKLTATDETFTSADVNFNHLLIGFPIKRGWGFSIGLVPVSNGYYFLAQEVGSGDPDYDPLTGPYTTIHKGTGGIASLYAGTGFTFWKNFSAGINMNILFGNIERLNQFEFADYTNMFNERSSELIRMAGISFEYGLQHTHRMKSDYFITTGLSFNFKKDYKSSIEKLEKRFTGYPSTVFSPDTLDYYSVTSRDSTTLPLTIRAGITFGKKDKFAFEFDYVWSKWSDARIVGSRLEMRDTKAFMAGFEFIPDKYNVSSFLKRIEYRIGGHYSDSYIVIDGVQLKEYGASLGFGIRMRGSPSKTTVFADYTRREGDISKGLHNEDIFTFGISLNLYDLWFMKKKYE
jgi:hypothetical protein